ncbi:centromere-associated protein E-like isoform X2 [Rhopilema esculentum]|uniref:centromere-associated protein E-like isoform X2 n=1 Tax=Rhopilema esculentum TaxID=499914 RepID=UPI0031D26F5E
MGDTTINVSVEISDTDGDDADEGAKASLPSTPKESPPSPQLSRIPRFNRRLSSTPGLEQESPGRANSQASLNSSAGIVQSPGPDRISPNNGRLSKKRLSANDLYAESRRSSIPAFSVSDRGSERGDRGVSRSSSRRPSLSDSGNGASLFSSLHASGFGGLLDSSRSSSRRGSSLAIDQDAAKKEGVISFNPQIRTAPVSDPGRVQVFVRIRPRNDDEEARGDPMGVSIEDQQMTQLKVLDGKNERFYQFDGVLPEVATNREVFKEVAQPLLRSALSGFNGILMCYGQTGTGKTYTLMSNDGMTVRVICKCFRVINKDKKHKYTVTCSYLQIYQDKIYDLLNATRTVDLSLREHPKRGVYVENLTEYVVHSPKEVLNLLKVGRRRLVFAETQMNRASSRSHAICELRILKERAKDNLEGSRSQTPSFNEMHMHEADLSSSWSADMMADDDYGEEDMFGESMNISRTSIDMMENEDDEEFVDGLTDLDDSVTSVRGKIYICDLAGSERIKRTKASGERLQEAQHINSSLLELGNVIQALAEGHRSHVPFRNSTLTRLLQEGLSGNCKTRLVVCVAPTAKDVHETKCSLNFGSRAMKVQVTAHVNYEVDYKKLAECLAAKLENLELEWNVQKNDYEKFIQSLKHEIANRRGLPGKHFDGPLKDERSNADKQQVQSLLVLELMTLQLFYGLQGKGHLIGSEETAHARITLMSDCSRDVLMQSMEGLLELLNDYERGPIIKAASRTSSTGSSAITSPDYIEHNTLEGSDLPPTLEPVARFLEHAQQIEMNYKNNIVMEKVSKERTRRVLEQLAHLKESISSAALGYLKKTFEVSEEMQETTASTLTSVEDLVSNLQAKNELNFRKDAAQDIGMLENSLYYLLMDKALLNCILMVGSQSENFAEIWSQISTTRVEESDEDRKRMIEELKTEKRDSEKLKTEVFDLREEKNASDEKVKDLELELKTVRELKGSLETKLFALESKNSKLEEQVEKIRKDKSDLEGKMDDLEKRKELLENNLRLTENNNAKKERLLVDLRNEKVALDSIVSTLKDELTILEKEKLRDRDERRRIEEELDDVKDRNIILETEWSCCKEENGLLETELTALEEDKAELEDELSKYREDVRMLEEALDILQREAEDYKTEINNLRSKEEKLVNVIKQEKDRFNKELSAMKQEISSLRVEKRRFQRDISVSKADRSNTERAYNSLKNQKDALQGDISTMRQEEKRLHRELAALRNDKSRLEREVSSLKVENSRLKTELVSAEKLKMDVRVLQKNEEKLTTTFKQDREKLVEEMNQLKDKYGKLESEFNQLQIEKNKIWLQVKQYEHSPDGRKSSSALRRVNHPHSRSCSSPDKKLKSLSVNRPSSFGSVTEIEGKVLDLQRRLAFFMAEKEDMQKELIVSRENNKKLNEELRTLEQDTSHIQGLLGSLAEEKNSLLKRIEENEEVRKLLESEREQLRKAVQTSKEINSKLQIRVDEICERNRVVECDRVTLEQSVKKLQGEACVLNAENKHVRNELEKVEGELTETRKKIGSLSEDYKTINQKLTESESNEKEAKNQVLELQTENLNIKDQLSDCRVEEKELLKQLAALTEKFRLLESKVEEVLIERSVLMQHSTEKRLVLKHTKELREANSILEQSFHDLRLQMEKLNADVEDFKEEREEVEKLIKEFSDGDTEGLEEDTKKTYLDSLKALRVWILGLKEDRENLMEKTTALTNQLKELSKEKEEFSHVAADKAARIEQEKAAYQEKLSELYKQLEEIIQEKKILQAEIDFLRTQNSEVRAEIAIVLEENEKLENDLEELEEDFEKQQNELDSAKEETKNLLRQLCGIETKNLELCTDNSNYQDDIEVLKEKCDKLKEENNTLLEKVDNNESEKVTMHDRMLMAELEVSRMRVECEALLEQRKRIEGELINAEKDKHLLRTELTGLARALSPLKKEVRAAVEKQLELQMAPQSTSEKKGHLIGEEIIEEELSIAQEELADFNTEKAALEEEEKLLRRKIRVAMSTKKEVRQRLHDLILELSNDSGNESSEIYLSAQSSEVGAASVDDEKESDIAESNIEDDTEKSLVHLAELKDLIEQSEVLKEEENLLREEIEGAERAGSRRSQELSTMCTELKNVQDNLSLAMISRMQLSQRVHKAGKNAATVENEKCTLKVKEMQEGINNLKTNIKKCEKSGRTLLTDLKQFSSHLDHTENVLINIDNYKLVIRNHLKEYRERNAFMEGQLKVLDEDLNEMKERLPSSEVKGTQLLLETVQLHKHQSSLEEDLSIYESHNEELRAEATELSERFKELEQEKKLTNTTQETLEDSLENQQRKILQLQKEKETLAYEKNKLQTKLALFKDDKNRLLEDFARLNKSLSAYAQYNGELEVKLETFKDELTSLEEKASMVKNGKAKRLTNGLSALETVKNISPGLLCDSCKVKVQNKFSGVSKGTQQLGEELLDCIGDNMSLETAILTFIDQKSRLQEELMIIDSDRRSLENLLQAIHEKSHFDLSDSQLSLRTSTPFMYCSGRLSTRSKSMTSHSGDSFVGDAELPPSTPMRCHTALGICSSSSSLSQEYMSDGSVELGEGGVGTPTTKTGATLSQSAASKSSCDEGFMSGVTPDPMDENRNQVFVTVPEGQLLDQGDKHGKGKGNISGFLRKFTSSKRKKVTKVNGTGTL